MRPEDHHRFPVSTISATASRVVDEAADLTVPRSAAILLTLPILPSWADSRGRLSGRPLRGHPLALNDIRRWLP